MVLPLTDFCTNKLRKAPTASTGNSGNSIVADALPAAELVTDALLEAALAADYHSLVIWRYRC